MQCNLPSQNFHQPLDFFTKSSIQQILASGVKGFQQWGEWYGDKYGEVYRGPWLGQVSMMCEAYADADRMRRNGEGVHPMLLPAVTMYM